MKKRIAPSVAIVPVGSTGFFGSGSLQTFVDSKELWDVLLDACDVLSVPCSKEELISALQLRGFSEELTSQALLFLTKGHLIDSEIDVLNSRYSRHLRYFNMFSDRPQRIQEALTRKHVTILGCGGIGNYVSHMLAGYGVNLSLIDDDVVERVNLSRQMLFSESDIGQKKVEVAQRKLAKVNSEISITTKTLHVSRKEELLELQATDLVVLSADQPRNILSWVNAYCVDSQTPYVNVGYIGDIAVVGPFYIPGQTACAACEDRPKVQIDERASRIVADINKATLATSVPHVNAIAAGMAVSDIVGFLGGFLTPASANCRIGYFSVYKKTEIHQFQRNYSCSVCAGASTL